MRSLAIIAFLLLLGACGQSMATAGGGSRSGPIELEEIRGAGATDAFTLVQTLRPGWLRSSRQQTLSGDDGIVVYLERARMGGVGELRNISSANVGRIEFLSASVAQQRLGAGHLNGAIILYPVDP